MLFTVNSHAKWEIVGIGSVVAVTALARHSLPARIEVGEAVLGMAALLLVQGLVRDLVRLRGARAAAKSGAPRITCVCAESTIGATAILAGVLIVFAMTPVSLRVPSFAWPIGVGLVMVFGFSTRHLVLDWRERRLRWEPNHGGIVAWKK